MRLLRAIAQVCDVPRAQTGVDASDEGLSRAVVGGFQRVADDVTEHIEPVVIAQRARNGDEVQMRWMEDGRGYPSQGLVRDRRRPRPSLCDRFRALAQRPLRCDPSRQCSGIREAMLKLGPRFAAGGCQAAVVDSSVPEPFELFDVLRHGSRELARLEGTRPVTLAGAGSSDERGLDAV